MTGHWGRTAQQVVAAQCVLEHFVQRMPCTTTRDGRWCSLRWMVIRITPLTTERLFCTVEITLMTYPHEARYAALNVDESTTRVDVRISYPSAPDHYR